MQTKRILYGDAAIDVAAPGATALIDVATESLGVRSSTRACRNEKCGSCRLLVDDTLVTGCRVLWSEIPDGARIESYELMQRDPAVKSVVGAFIRERSTRCRMCVGALAVTALDLARRGKSDDEDAIEDALAAMTCLCTGRVSLRRALAPAESDSTDTTAAKREPER